MPADVSTERIYAGVAPFIALQFIAVALTWIIFGTVTRQQAQLF